LYFGRTAREELKYKQLVLGRRRNLALISKMQRHSIAQIRKSGIPFIIHQENQQVGDSFAEKLTNAIDHCFQNFEKVIVIGYDCPQLSTADIRSAAISLETDVSVVGADNHGGAYLIGLTKDRWNRNEFQQLSWQTNSLCEDLICNYFYNVDVRLHRTKIDVNTQQDLLALNTVKFSNGFVSELLVLLAQPIRHLLLVLSHAKKYFSIGLRFRGPPTARA